MHASNYFKFQVCFIVCFGWLITLVRPRKAYGLMLVPLGQALWLDRHKLASL